MSVKITDNTTLIEQRMRANIPVALKRAADDVLRISRPKTPKADTNFLRNNVRTQVLGLRAKIMWLAAYAQYQERGRRKDGTHVVKHYTTGGTGKAFAEDAVKKVNKDKNKYLRNLLK